MKRTRVLLAAVLAFTTTVVGQTPKSATPSASSSAQSPSLTVASLVDRQISHAEKRLVETAEAMPEDKFNFSPEALRIPSGDYKGVRTFAIQVKHVAASNYAIWSPLTGDKFPDDMMGGDGPASLKTKAEILKFLKDSFAFGHKAAA